MAPLTEPERERQDFNTFADEYAQFRKIDPPVLEDLLVKGNINAESVVLEVGCGTGNYLTEIASRTHALCYGLDPAEKCWLRPKPILMRTAFNGARGMRVS
ncbi:MAG: class I SAM-dependent methyltransferase [Anaerolineae bacterium]|nr:class I SAM-dependent methyltransferase [Anaerolineae bacterium]